MTRCLPAIRVASLVACGGVAHAPNRWVRHRLGLTRHWLSCGAWDSTLLPFRSTAALSPPSSLGWDRGSSRCCAGVVARKATQLMTDCDRSRCRVSRLHRIGQDGSVGNRYLRTSVLASSAASCSNAGSMDSISLAESPVRLATTRHRLTARSTSEITSVTAFWSRRK